MSASITNRISIECLRFRTICRGVILESRGLIKRGRSCTVIGKEILNLSKNASRQEVIDGLMSRVRLMEERVANGESEL